MKYRLLSVVCLALIGTVFAETAGDTAVVNEAAVAADTSASVAEAVVTEKEAPAADTSKADKADVETVAADSEAAAADTSTAAESVSTPTTDDDSADTTARRGLDLDRLLAEEDDEDDLLAEEKPVVQPETAADSASAVADSEQAESVQTESVLTEPSSETPADSLSQPDAQPAYRGRRGGPPPPVAKEEQIDDGPAVIVDGKTINFAQNLEGYRSPRVAMLLSLLVPGLGQAYSRNYVKAAAFGAVEVAGIVTAVVLNSAGKSRKRDAHRFADEHFDVNRIKDYEAWVIQEFESVANREDEDGEEQPSYDDYPIILQYYDTTFYNAAERRSSFFYTSIGDDYFTPGWIDSDPSWRGREYGEDGVIIGTDYVLEYPEVPALFYFIRHVHDIAGNPKLAFSSHQARYNSMIDDANSYHDAVNYTLYALIINHIASAIDAGFTARAYNARLLGQESVWDRISVEQQYVFTGSEMSPGIALRFKF